MERARSIIFIDTSGWGNLVDSSQPYYILSSNIYRRAKAKNVGMITSNFIIAELVALLSSPLRIPRLQIISFIEALRESSYIEIIHIDLNIEKQTWKLLKNRSDKNWSLVDCSSFMIMN